MEKPRQKTEKSEKCSRWKNLKNFYHIFSSDWHGNARFNHADVVTSLLFTFILFFYRICTRSFIYPFVRISHLAHSPATSQCEYFKVVFFSTQIHIRGKRREEKWTTTKIVRQNNLTLAPNVISKPFIQLYKRYTLYIIHIKNFRKTKK